MDLGRRKRYRFVMAAKRESPLKKLIIASLTLIAVVGIVVFVYTFMSVRNKLQTKAEYVQSLMEAWVDDGYDPSAALAVMKKVQAASEEEDAAENVGKLLDKAQALLDVPPEKRPKVK